MATQLAALSGFRRNTGRKFLRVVAPKGDQRHTNLSLSCPKNLPYQLIKDHTPSETISEEQHGKCSRKKKLWRGQRQKRARLVRREIGVWLLASSVSYVLKKAKAIQKKFSSNVAKHPSRMGNEASLVGVYFSVPMVPAPVVPLA